MVQDVRLLTFRAPITLSTIQANPITELFVFGDSLSDVGTVFRTTGSMRLLIQMYHKGRYSNGRVWVEYLADRLSCGECGC